MTERALAPVIEFQNVRAAIRAQEVLRGLLGPVPWVSAVRVEVEHAGTVVLVVLLRCVDGAAVRAVVPTAVNGVPVRVRVGTQSSRSCGRDSEQQRIRAVLDEVRADAAWCEEVGEHEKAQELWGKARKLAERLTLAVESGGDGPADSN